MSKRYRKQRSNKNKSVSASEWERLLEDVTLREAYTTFAQEVQLSQNLAEERARLSGRPVESMLDLRNAGRVLDQYPQLVRYLDGLRDREALRQEAMNKPDLALSSPTGNIRGNDQGMLGGGWVGSGVGKNQPIGVHNVRQLRDWSDNDPIVSAAKAFLCNKVSRADIAVLPLDERKPYNRKAMKAMELVLDQPNEYRDTWPNLMYQFANDYLTLGQGTITKNMTLKTRLPVALYAEDAANIKIYPAWSGDPNEPRYLYDEGILGMAGNKKPLRNDEVIIAFCNPASYRFGLGHVQVLADTIEAHLRATASALRMVEQKPPGSVVSLPGWSQQAISKLRSDYETEISGRRELLFLGGTNAAHVFPLVFSPRDNQFLEYQQFLTRVVCTVFGISGIDLNMIQDVNRATAGAQVEISDSKGFIPLLLAFETCLNVELLADFAPKLPFERFDLNALNLRVAFPEISEAERMLHAEKMITLAQEGLQGLPSFTINEVRMMAGQEPFQKGGNTLWVKTTNGPMPWLSHDGEYGDYSGPVAGSDALGSQDDAGGPSADDTSDDDFAADESTGEQDASGGPSSADTGSNTAEKRYKAMKTSDDEEEQTGVMVAFFLDKKTAKELALPDGEPAEDMHVTLAFLGDKSDYEQGFAKLKKALAGFASEAIPLSGNVSGLARFAPSESSDGKAPVVALVNVSGLQKWRDGLVKCIEGVGYTVAKDFEYTPHITLDYVDADDPMPVDEVPDVALTFDQLWLAVGDERTSFKIGDEQYPKYWEDREKRYIPQRDTRRPGKHWNPSHALVANR
jgi:2'-5' RNA ligase